MKDTNAKETAKTIALTALVAGVLGFCQGNVYGKHQVQDTQAAVQSAVRAVQSPSPAPSKP